MATLLGLDAFGILSKYGIPVAKTLSVGSAQKLDSWKLPFYMKAISAGAIHKTEKNAVVQIQRKDQIAPEFSRLAKIGKVEAQEEVDGVEVLIGAKEDETFGKVVACGLGGIYVDVLKDISFRAAPLKRSDARDMIRELKSYKIISGFRGQKTNVEALENALIAAGKLAIGENVKEMDINPFVLSGSKAYAVDARIVI